MTTVNLMYPVEWLEQQPNPHKHIDVHDLNPQITLELLADVDTNRDCADCQLFGIHRSMGTHISKVRSLTLDEWNSDQLRSLYNVGNTRANSYFLSLPPTTTIPSHSTSMMTLWIRAKYEKKLWVNPSLLPVGTPKIPSFIDITVTDPEHRVEQDGRKEYTSYLVTVSTNLALYQSTFFSIKRRYAEFRKMYEDYLKAFPEIKKKLPRFPAKTPLNPYARFDLTVIEYRRNTFEKVLNIIVNTPQYRDSPILHNFLVA